MGEDVGGRIGEGNRVGSGKGCGVMLEWFWGAVGTSRRAWERIQAMDWGLCASGGGGLGSHQVGNRGMEGVGDSGTELGQTAGRGRETRGAGGCLTV